jgi:membrane-bound serine protease (ClpP class)
MYEHTVTFIVISNGTLLRQYRTIWIEGMNVMWNLTLALILGFFTAGALILAFLVKLAFRSHRTNVETSTSRMIGLKGKAVTEVAPEGRVSVQGEYWWAYSRVKIAEGETVRVVGIDGLTLEIESCPDKAVIPRPVSAIEHHDV